MTMWCYLCRLIRHQMPVDGTPKQCAACGYERSASWMFKVFAFHNRNAGVALGRPEKWALPGVIEDISENESVMHMQIATIRPKFCPVRFPR